MITFFFGRPGGIYVPFAIFCCFRLLRYSRRCFFLCVEDFLGRPLPLRAIFSENDWSDILLLKTMFLNLI